MKVVSVRRADNPNGRYRRDANGVIIRDKNGLPEMKPAGDFKYQAGIYKLSKRKRDGVLFFILDGKLGGIFKNRKTCEKKARNVCKEKKEEYIYIDSVRQYTHLSSLSEDLATYLDFELAIEENEDETA